MLPTPLCCIVFVANKSLKSNEEETMENIAKGLIGAAILGFLLAVIFSLAPDQSVFVTGEGFSRACNNLALIAIALMLMGKKSMT